MKASPAESSWCVFGSLILHTMCSDVLETLIRTMFSAFCVPGVLPVKCTWMTFSATMASKRRAVQLQQGVLGPQVLDLFFRGEQKTVKATCNPMICELPAFWAHAVCWFFRTWTLRGCRVSMRFFLNAIKPPAPPMSRWPTTWHDHQEGLQNNLFNYFQFPNWLDNLKAEQARSPFIPPVNDRAAASVATGWG